MSRTTGGSSRGATHVNARSSKSSTRESSSRRSTSAVLAVLLVTALSTVGLTALASPASAASLAAVSPVDNATGYPFWFGDRGDAQQGLEPLRLELCLDDVQDPLCPVVGDRPQPDQPLSVPENFPDESFWWSGEARSSLRPGSGPDS